MESVQVYAKRLYALANDAFTKVDKAVVESQLAGFFIDRLYNDFLFMKVMRRIQNHCRLQYSLHWQKKIAKEISNDHEHPKTRTEEPMETGHIKTSQKCFLCDKVGYLARHCKSR